MGGTKAGNGKRALLEEYKTQYLHFIQAEISPDEFREFEKTVIALGVKPVNLARAKEEALLERAKRRQKEEGATHCANAR